jgi:hypothetical protein
MDFIRIIIDIAKKDKRWKYYYRKNTINWWNQMVCMSFKFDKFVPSCKYGLSPTIIKKTINLFFPWFIVHGCHFYIIFEAMLHFRIFDIFNI